MKFSLVLLVLFYSFQVFSQSANTSLDFVEEDFSDINIAKERAKLPWATSDIYANLFKKDVIIYENTFMDDVSEPESFPYEMVIDKTYGEGVIKTGFMSLMLNKDETNSETGKKFYPFAELATFRVIDTKSSITTKAGEFECTVIEGFFDTDKQKLWMINDMPGYYAKVLTVQGPEKDGLTIISELAKL